MTANRLSISTLAVAVAAGWAAPAAAQDDAAVAREIAAMRAQMAAMASRIDMLEAELETAKAQPSPPAPVAVAAIAPIPAPAPAAETKTAWKGAPEFTTASGWSFKSRGRIQVDAGNLSAPDGIVDTATGFGSELRRAYLGFDGKIPGGFGYRAEIDVAASSVEITDLYLTYEASKELGLTVGQHKPFWGLEELTSDLFTTMTERAAMNTAFGFERRLGASATYSAGDVVVQAGAFTDNVADLNDDGNNSVSLDGRAVFAPKLAGGQLHLGGSVHWHDLNDSASSVRYRVRPFIHTPDIRFIDTGNLSARSELGYGLEAAFIKGPFHVTGETHWQRVNRPGALTDPTFFGGYAEAGVFLTKGDTRGYKGGTFDRVKPANPVSKGGMGAVQFNVRYDYLDLVDGGVVGGRQNGYEASLIWTPIDYVRFVLNYGHVVYSDAAIPAAGGDRNYAVDAVGMRAQIDF
ncbi:OprO/OprP family phosphate-selective porin [Tsuneonella amylolytica]|uniref:OprO/OprP family phosphate-selective porin n=1 Tax=Tsuneonella amylolytica TaxID=2338327 RepID=UPI000EA96599|nr:OprO/OprP family phosphate-selective porin [Tsuneonella amylolytica]